MWGDGVYGAAMCVPLWMFMRMIVHLRKHTNAPHPHHHPSPPSPPPASPILGVVELSQQSDPTVIASARLPPTSVYAYVACMAVRSSHRRQGVSQALLSACDYLASAWGIAWLALHVDADNAAAVGAYRKAGFAEVAATGGGLFGGRRRLLMVRRVGAGEVGGEGGGRGAPLLP